jgi:hypothetical protein
MLGICQIEVNSNRAGAGSSKFIDRSGKIGSRPRPSPQSFQRAIVNVGHDDLRRHWLSVSGKMLLFEIQKPLIPAVESTDDIDQYDKKGPCRC